MKKFFILVLVLFAGVGAYFLWFAKEEKQAPMPGTYFSRTCFAVEDAPTNREYSYSLDYFTKMDTPTRCFVTLSPEDKHFIMEQISSYNYDKLVTRDFYLEMKKEWVKDPRAKTVEAKYKSSPAAAYIRVLRDFGGSKYNKHPRTMQAIQDMLKGKLTNLGVVDISQKDTQDGV